MPSATTVSSSSGSSSGGKKGGKADKSNNTTGYSSGYYTQQTPLSEINKTPIYRRLACIRYTRPMMPTYGCWGPGSMCGPPCGFPPCGCNPYCCGFPNQCPGSTRALIIPPRPKNCYRPAREDDFVLNLACGEGPIGPKRVYAPSPPPPRPKVDRTKIVKQYLHDVKRRSPSPPPKRRKSPPQRKPFMQGRRLSAPPPEEEKKPPTRPPTREEVQAAPLPPPEEKKKPQSPMVEKKPSPLPPKSKAPSESSKSSVKADKNDYHFRDRKYGEIEHHFYEDVARRDSSFAAVTKQAKHVKHHYLPIEAVAPQRRK